MASPGHLDDEAAVSPLTEWARLVMVTLADSGVRDVVVSPGSRSTPYIVAACNEARLRPHSVIDERAAGFFALGLAKASGRPAAVLCTSGSAVAHYYPAVVEADSAGIPLLVLSADRPFELQARSAPQTIDQVKIFADRVRAFVETGMPEHHESALVGVRRALALAVAETLRPGRRGPVHINLRARKPLEPEPASASDGARRHRLATVVDGVLARPVPRYESTASVSDERSADELEELVRQHPRAIIQCGPAALREGDLAGAVHELARATGYPVYAEAASMLRFVPDAAEITRLDTLPMLGALLDESEQPGLILHVGGAATFGRAPTARRAEVVTFSHHGVVDPENEARIVFQGNAAAALRELARRTPKRVVDEAWRESVARKDRAVRDVLESKVDDGVLLQEGRIAAALVGALPADATLVLGNSLAIRSVELFCVRAEGKSLEVVSQRGANGIDGHVALTAGVAAARGKPTALLLGDVSLLHDIGSLLVARECTTPLLVVVMQNGGGRIFDQLPLAGHPLLPGNAWDLVVTPRHVELESICRGFGVRYERVETVGALRGVLREHHVRGGVTLVEAVTDPASSAKKEVAAMRAAAAAAVRGGAAKG